MHFRHLASVLIGISVLFPVFGFLQTRRIRASYNIREVTVASKKATLMNDWRLADNCKDSDDTVILVRKSAPEKWISVSYKGGLVYTVVGDQIRSSSGTVVKDMDAIAVHQILGIPSGPLQGGELPGDLYEIRNVVGQVVLRIGVEYNKGRAERYSIQLE